MWSLNFFPVSRTVTFEWTLRPIPNDDDDQYTFTPYFRYGHTVVTYEPHGLIYLYGGRADWTDNLSADLYSYSPREHEWSILKTNGQKPEGRDGHSACVANSSMYIFGGYVQVVYSGIFGHHDVLALSFLRFLQDTEIQQ